MCLCLKKGHGFTAMPLHMELEMGLEPTTC